jgi:hypothetical protein
MAKEKGRDNTFDFDSCSKTPTMNLRGIREEIRKYLEHAAQCNTQLSNQQYEAEVMKITSVLSSKSCQFNCYIALHTALSNAG